MKKSMFVLCLISAGLGMLFSTLTMSTNDGPQNEKEVVVLRVVERKTDYAYIVRLQQANTKRVYYSEQKFDIPLFEPTTIVVNEREILRP